MTTTAAEATTALRGAASTPSRPTELCTPSIVSIGKSHNFGGYDVRHDGKVVAVSASYKVPKVHGACPSRVEGAFTGIEVDGVASPITAFAGTQSYCSAGHAG